MKIPRYEIQGDTSMADAILADKTPKRYERSRAYARGNARELADSFDGKMRSKPSVYFHCMRLFSIVFAVALACAVYFAVAATHPKEGLALYLTAAGLGILGAVFLALYLTERAFVKSQDELYILFDEDGAFYAVEIAERRVRILYKHALYVLKGGKIKQERSEKKLYYAYLNLFPASVLNMRNYFDAFDNGKASVIASTHNGNLSLDVGALGQAILPMHPWARQLHFSKYLFCLNDGQPTDVYSAARENAVLGFDICTRALVKESGEQAKESFARVLAANETLHKALAEVYPHTH